MAFPVAGAVARCIDELARLPGIGPKTASRLTYYLLRAPEAQARARAAALVALKERTVFCSRCCNIADTDPCLICSSPNRDQSLLCVVEEPLDLLALERTGQDRGRRPRSPPPPGPPGPPARGPGPRGGPRHEPEPRRRGHRHVPARPPRPVRRLGHAPGARTPRRQRPRVRRRPHPSPRPPRPPGDGVVCGIEN